MMLIEGVAFALAIAAYFYIRLRNETWPPNVMPPLLRWGTLNTIVLLVSAIPKGFLTIAQCFSFGDSIQKGH